MLIYVEKNKFNPEKWNIVIIYPLINEHDESKIEEFDKQQWALNIPFRESLATFY